MSGVWGQMGTLSGDVAHNYVVCKGDVRSVSVGKYVNVYTLHRNDGVSVFVSGDREATLTQFTCTIRSKF